MDTNIFIGVMSINMGIGVACAFILQLCKIMFYHWLSEEDIRSNNVLTAKAFGYSILCYIILIIFG